MRIVFNKRKWFMLVFLMLVLPLCVSAIVCKNAFCLQGDGEAVLYADDESVVASAPLDDSLSRTLVAGSLAKVYWNPTSGSNSNAGTTSATAVQSLDTAKELVQEGGEIYMLGQYDVSATSTLNFGGATLVLCSMATGNAYFYVNGAYEVTLQNVKIKTETATQSDVTLPIFKGSTTTTLSIESNVSFENIYSSNVLISGFNKVTISGATFKNNTIGGVIDSITSGATISFSNSYFYKNVLSSYFSSGEGENLTFEKSVIDDMKLTCMQGVKAISFKNCHLAQITSNSAFLNANVTFERTEEAGILSFTLDGTTKTYSKNVVTGCTFTNGLYPLGTSGNSRTVTIKGMTFSGNTGITLIRTNAYTTCILDNVYQNVFEGNTGDKGGVINYASGNLVIKNGATNFSNNTSDYGAIAYISSGELSLSSSQIKIGGMDELTSSCLGGMFYVIGGKLNLKEFSFSVTANSHSFIYVAEGGTLEYSNSTIKNSKTSSSIIYVLGTATLNNLTIVGCNGMPIGAIYVGGKGVSNINNISTKLSSDSTTIYSNKNQYGGTITCGLVDSSPKLNDNALTYNGGKVNFYSGSLVGEEDAEPSTSYGGAVYVGTGAVFEMQGGSISGNSAKFGSQIYVKGTATIRGGTKYNKTTNAQIVGEGGYVGSNTKGEGIYVAGSGTLNLYGGVLEAVTVDTSGNFYCDGGKLGSFTTSGNSTLKINNAIFGNVNESALCYASIGSQNTEINSSLISAKVTSNTKSSVFSCSSGAGLKLNNCDITACSVSSGDWPTIFLVSGASLALDGCEIYNNNCTVFCSVDASSDIQIDGCNIRGNNTAKDDIFAQITNAKTFVMTNSTYTNNSAGTIVLNNVGESAKLEDCQFTSNPVARNQGVVETSCSGLKISGCTFDGNSAGMSGSVYIGGGKVEMTNCTFTNCVANFKADAKDTTAYGGAINLNAGELTLNGKIKITGNKTCLTGEAIETGRDALALTGGGIYVKGQLYIEQNAEVICRENYREIGDNLSYKDNMYIASLIKNILKGDLNGGSEIWLSCVWTDDSANEQDALLSVDINSPVTNELLDLVVCDQSDNYGFRFVAVQDGKNGVVFYKKAQDGLWVLAHDKSVTYSVKQSQKIDAVKLMAGGEEYSRDYKVYYSTGEGVSYSEQLPEFRNVGQYAVMYKIETYNGDESITMSGYTYLRILGVRLFIESYPEVRLASGAYLSSAVFYGGKVVDAEGATVAGVWAFDEGGKKGEDGVKYPARFVPANTINLQVSEDSLKADLEVKILFQTIFYTSEGFSTSLEATSNSIITGCSTLLEAVNLIEDGGTIVFNSTYEVKGAEIITLTDKKVTFTRHKDFTSTTPMIWVKTGSLNLSGNIYIDGLAPYGGRYETLKRYSIFTIGVAGGSANSATLTLGEGVKICNWNVRIDSNNIGLITVLSSGKAILDGCEIYANKMMLVYSNLVASIITNNGTLVIEDGKFFNNILVNLSSGVTSTTPYGNGGFLACTSGSSTTMRGGEIYGNSANYGGAIYLVDGTLDLEGGKIYANKGMVSGGALYIKASSSGSAEVTIVDCEISGNMSKKTAIVFDNIAKNEGVTIIENGKTVSSASALAKLEEIEAQNLSYQEFDEVVDEASPDQAFDISIVILCAFCVAFVCLVFYRFNRKNKQKLIKK